MYNTRTSEIKNLGELSEPRFGLVLVNCLGKVYALGGASFRKHTNKIQQLNQATNQ